MECKRFFHNSLQDITNSVRFLWVAYQIREICEILFEQDIIIRLGKLPKDLTGVYDEIMDSIHKQSGSTPQVAARALKWILAAERPLKPSELATAIEIDPATQLHVSATESCLKPSRKIELVIASCGGLIL